MQASQVALVVKNPPANAGDITRHGFDPWVGKIPSRGHPNPLQYSCLENILDTGAWWTVIHRLAKSWTQIKQLISHAHTILNALTVYKCHIYIIDKISIFQIILRQEDISKT